MPDRQIKLLLTIIAVALCGILMENTLRLQPVSASPAPTPDRSAPAISCLDNSGACIAVEDHKVYYIHETATGFKVDWGGQLK